MLFKARHARFSFMALGCVDDGAEHACLAAAAGVFDGGAACFNPTQAAAAGHAKARIEQARLARAAEFFFNAEAILATQTRFEPLAPIASLYDQDGWVVLINVDHTNNTSIHYAEKLAGRQQFLRWALVGDRAVECQNYPGDSTGFNAIAPYIQPDIFRIEIGKGFIEAMPLKRLTDVVVGLIRNDPLALLCERKDCLMCNAVRGIYALG